MSASMPSIAVPKTSRRRSNLILCYTKRRSKRPASCARKARNENKNRRRTMSMVATRDGAAATSLEFVPLTRHIGCEVRGVDLRQPVDAAAAKAIYQAWLDHAVLVFRGQNLSQEDLIRVT